jgi:ubiquinone/menaquinone biosynthesis C-methylase UbiE
MTTEAKRKRAVAEVFDRAAESYDTVAGSYFSFFGPRIAAAAEIPPGSTLLDVACGKGAVLIPAAHKAGLAIGVDISLEMVRAARARADEDGLENVHVVVTDGDRLPFPDACVDVLTCAFSLHFFADPSGFVAECARVLKPGGRIAFSEWGADDERWGWESELIGALPGKGVTTASFEDGRALESLLASSGLTDLHSIVERFDVHLADEEEWWAWKWSYSFRYVLEQLDDETHDRFKTQAFEKAAAMNDGDGIPLTLEALIAVGRAPSVRP